MVASLIAELETAGMRLSVRDGALAVQGPRAVMTPERVAAIRANRAELVAALSPSARITGSEPAENTATVELLGAGVIVAGLDKRSRHRLMWEIAGHHWLPVQRVATRHDYVGGVLTMAAENAAVARRVAKLARRALALPEPTGANE